jgi:hypothetical protein
MNIAEWPSSAKKHLVTAPQRVLARYGARDAIEMSARVLSMWRAKTKWDSADGPRKLLLDKIFKLSPNVKPSDNTV